MEFPFFDELCLAILPPHEALDDVPFEPPYDISPDAQVMPWKVPLRLRPIFYLYLRRLKEAQELLDEEERQRAGHDADVYFIIFETALLRFYPDLDRKTHSGFVRSYIVTIRGDWAILIEEPDEQDLPPATERTPPQRLH